MDRDDETEYRERGKGCWLWLSMILLWTLCTSEEVAYGADTLLLFGRPFVAR